MNKKAAVILLAASLAFFVAGVILMNTIKTPRVLGETQLNLSMLHKEGELYMAYIDNAAKFALAETVKTVPSGSQDFYTLCKTNHVLCNDFSKYFGEKFAKHLASFNKAYNQDIGIKSYKFSSKPIRLNNQPAIELIGVSTEQIRIQKGEDITYLLYPNFKVQADLEELNKLATTKETLAIAFFNELANKVYECLKQKNSKLDNCFCDDSEIDVKNLPEDYKISIITTADREKLFGGVVYYFKLLDSKGKPVTIVRDQPVSTNFKSIFGAYEYIDEDTKKNVCYPGAFAKDRTYTFEGVNQVKGRLYLFSGEANCVGVSKFNMVGFIKESDYGKVTGSDCSLIGVKTS